MALLSTGIDSPVACYMMLKKGFKVEYLHFSNSLEKIVEIAKLLRKFGGANRFFCVSHERMMKEILKLKFDRKYTCVMCKKGMLLLAEMLANRLGCEVLVTGDNLGQVASQTISNLKAEEEQIRIPVLRPLIGFDKMEIVDIARKIGTYEISIKREVKCKFAPEKPATKSKNLPKIDVESLKKLEMTEINLNL